MLVELVVTALVRPEPVSRSERRHELPPRTHELSWDAIAECESGGDWSIDSGNGYYGGLQISEQTWDAMDGQQFAARPDLAPRADQIVVAERIKASQGLQAGWPVCWVRAA